MDDYNTIKKEFGNYKKDVVIDQKELDREKLSLINQFKNGYGEQIKNGIKEQKNISCLKKMYFIIKQFFINQKKNNLTNQ